MRNKARIISLSQDFLEMLLVSNSSAIPSSSSVDLCLHCCGMIYADGGRHMPLLKCLGWRAPRGWRRASPPQEVLCSLHPARRIAPVQWH